MGAGAGKPGPESICQDLSEYSTRHPSMDETAAQRRHCGGFEMQKGAQEQDRPERTDGCAQPDTDGTLRKTAQAELAEQGRKQVRRTADQEKESPGEDRPE